MLNIMRNDNLYFCDLCYVDKIDDDENPLRKYFSCYTNQQWKNHITSKKHAKAKEEVEANPDVVVCKHCNKKFTNDGYKEHERKNKEMWELSPQSKCNIFTTGKHRFKSFQALKEWKTRPKQTRTPVGKYSPITHTIRQANKNNIKVLRKEPKEIKVKEANLEDDIPKCDCCDGHFNHSDHSDKHVEEVLKKKLCDCPDEPMKEKIIDGDEDIMNEFNKLNNIKTKEDKKKLELERKTDGLKLTIDEIDHTEKPEFYDYCSNCGGGKIEEGLTTNIYEKWSMEYCECSKTDSEYETDEE